MTIGPFRGEYRWLSNFWEAPFYLDGARHQSTEIAYQISKCAHTSDMFRIINASGSKEAKEIGQTVKMWDGFESNKDRIMFSLNVLKFTQNPELARKLANTGSEEIVELNHWCDNYWGVCNCRKCDGKLGENRLGKILMDVRLIVSKM